MNAFSPLPKGTPGRRRQVWAGRLVWALALVFSAGLNFFLFGIMPGMISAVPTGPDKLAAIQNLSVVRVKRAEPPARRKEKARLPKPEPRKPRPVRRVEVSPPRPRLAPQRLPFELNAKLPTAELAFSMPPAAEFAMAGPMLKDVYAVGELDSPLVPLVRVQPPYPPRASRRGIQGWVEVAFTVNAAGLVEDIEVLRAKPKRIFDKNVIKYVSQWKFKPGTVTGEPVSTRVKTTIKFELEK